MGLALYKKKRDFSKTPEPGAKSKGASKTKRDVKDPIFVIQEHHATRLHFDFRLEEEGVLKSWAVTKEPTMEEGVRRLAIEVEDHPLDYATFHGTIPKGEYGGGDVKIWDHGTFKNVMATKAEPLTVSESIDAGHVEVHLKGSKLKGTFALVRLEKAQGSKPSWLMLKMKKKAELSPLERARRFAAKSTRAAKPAVKSTVKSGSKPSKAGKKRAA